MPGPVSELFSTVVANDFCIGCGACAAFEPAISIELDAIGRYQARINSGLMPTDAAISEVCPFANGNPDEHDLASRFLDNGAIADPHLGRSLATYAGCVIEGSYREQGSSGGLVSWLLAELLERKMVDFVVHVAPSVEETTGAPLFKFTVSQRPEDVRSGSKSRYYPVEMSQVISEMLRVPGRYAIVGVPCFIKAVRLASIRSNELAERVTFAVAIVCGHLKTASFAELLGWQCGIEPGNLKGIDFRTKLPDPPASSYAVTAVGGHGDAQIAVTKPMSEMIGSNWGHGLFKYKACDFCDDVVGETADISIGDAWLPEYNHDPQGTNVITVRADALNTLLLEAMAENRLALDVISKEQVVASQAGGFRHRRDGLAYRLKHEDEEGHWRPIKRVSPSAAHLSRKSQRVYQLRYELAMLSHGAFAAAKVKGDLEMFRQLIGPWCEKLDYYNRRSPAERVIRKLGSLIKSWLWK